MRKRILVSLLLAFRSAARGGFPGAGGRSFGLRGKLVILHTNDVPARAVANAEEGIFGYAALAD